MLTVSCQKGVNFIKQNKNCLSWTYLKHEINKKWAPLPFLWWHLKIMPFYFFLIGDRHGRNALYIAFSTAMWRLTYSFGPLAFSDIWKKFKGPDIYTRKPEQSKNASWNIHIGLMMHCFERDIDMLVVIEKDHLHYYLFYSNQQQAAITSFIFYAFISILLLGLIPQFI